MIIKQAHDDASYADAYNVEVRNTYSADYRRELQLNVEAAKSQWLATKMRDRAVRLALNRARNALNDYMRLHGID